METLENSTHVHMVFFSPNERFTANGDIFFLSFSSDLLFAEDALLQDARGIVKLIRKRIQRELHNGMTKRRRKRGLWQQFQVVIVVEKSKGACRRGRGT